MVVSALFVILALLAVVGAGGLLFLRRAAHCVLAFLLCTAALAGLYLLLSLQYMAAIQLTVGVGLMGLLLSASLPFGLRESDSTPYSRASSRDVDDPRSDLEQRSSLARRLRWGILAAMPFVVAGYWGVARGVIGEPVLTSPPVWAVRGEYISALGQEMMTSYFIPFALLGLLLLVCLVCAAYLIRQGKDQV